MDESELPSSSSDFTTPLPFDAEDGNGYQGDILRETNAPVVPSPNQQFVNLPSPSLGNGRVYQFQQDGKLKLKISLKGLGECPSIDDVCNRSVEQGAPQQTAHSQNSHTATSTQRDDTQLSSTPNGEIPSNTQASQSVMPPSVLVQPSFIESNTNENDVDDIFSDDVNLSEIEDAKIDSMKLSDSISCVKSKTTFQIVLKFSPENKYKIHTDNLSCLESSKRINAKTKSKVLTPKKTKAKKRPKPLYSRLMVKNSAGVPLSVVEDNLPQAANEDDHEDDGLIEQSVRLSLMDPLSGSKMVTPLRSRFCSHVECFDYGSFLAMYNLRPFRIAMRRHGIASPNVGDVDILKILEDTKREVINVQQHNVQTTSFQYNAKLRTLKEKGKNLNELEWFCCPICKLEFNIKKLGDVYVVGEFIDLLQDLQFEENHEHVHDVEIDMSNRGSWRWIKEEDTVSTSQTPNPHKHPSTATPDPPDSEHQHDHHRSSKQTINNVEVISLSDEEDETDTQLHGPSSGQQLPTKNSNEGTTVVSTPAFPKSDLVVENSEEDMLRQLDMLFESELFQKQSNLHNAKFIQSANQEIQRPGVVAFRPGPFTATPATPEPVFMHGIGEEDDPIVLD